MGVHDPPDPDIDRKSLRPVEPEEEDAVGGLLPDAPEREKRFAGFPEGQAGDSREKAGIISDAARGEGNPFFPVPEPA